MIPILLLVIALPRGDMGGFIAGSMGIPSIVRILGFDLTIVRIYMV